MPAACVSMLAIAAMAAVASAVLTLVALRYAHWRRMLDQPGQRRMHSSATPRGGGIAIVLVTAVAGWMLLPMPLGAVFVLGLLAVAGVGWVDDHRPLSARARLAVHLLASLIFVATLWPLTSMVSALQMGVFAIAVVGLAGAVNLWNFMDGSNGLVASQSAWVAVGLAFFFALAGDLAWAACAAVLAGACLGFLPFNAPRARIFLGDVGSGGLGFACAALWLVMFDRISSGVTAIDLQRVELWWLVLLPAVLLIDAGLTLLQRIVLGRRWYTAHREHLYQWLIRAGASHAGVAAAYLGWNLLVLLPAMLAVRHWPQHAAWIVTAVLMLTGATWCIGKRAVLRRVRNATVDTSH